MSYYFFQQRGVKHIFAFVLMTMRECLKEHMREVMDYVFCALCLVCPGRAASCHRHDCNRQSTQRVQNTWSIGTGLCIKHQCSDTNMVIQTAIFLILFVRNNKRSSGIDGQRLAFQKLFILPLYWVIFLLVAVLWIVWKRDCCFFADFLAHGKRTAGKKH